MKDSKKRPLLKLREDAETSNRIMHKMTELGTHAVTAETKCIGRIASQNVIGAVAIRVQQPVDAATARHATDKHAKVLVIEEFNSKTWHSRRAAAITIHSQLQTKLTDNFPYTFDTVYRWILNPNTKKK